MNIAMLSYHTCPLATLGGKDTGGMNVYVAELTRHLGQLDVHVDVFTRSQDEHVPHVLHNLGYGNRVVHIPAGPEIPLPKAELVKYIPAFVNGILDFTGQKGLRYDLIHSHYWMSGLAAEQLQMAWKTPIVQMFHTLGLMKNRIARSPEEMEIPLRPDAERRILKLVDRIIAATPAEKSQLEFLYHADSAKLVVIPPGVDTSRFYPIPKDEARAVIELPPDGQMVLFVGRMDPLKGLDTLLHALAFIKNSHRLDCCPHYLAIIGGDPAESDENLNREMLRVKQLNSSLGLNDIVLFLGRRSQESLPYYYSAADVVVMPSHYESFGMVALEAMACGTPVIASQVGGLPFLVQDGVTGFVVPNGEPELLGEHLVKLLIDPELRTRLGEKGADIARDYSWNVIARQIYAVYQEVMDNANVSRTTPYKTGTGQSRKSI